MQVVLVSSLWQGSELQPQSRGSKCRHLHSDIIHILKNQNKAKNPSISLGFLFKLLEVIYPLVHLFPTQTKKLRAIISSRGEIHWPGLQADPRRGSWRQVAPTISSPPAWAAGKIWSAHRWAFSVPISSVWNVDSLLADNLLILLCLAHKLVNHVIHVLMVASCINV